jgi:hypothetical protein
MYVMHAVFSLFESVLRVTGQAPSFFVDTEGQEVV